MGEGGGLKMTSKTSKYILKFFFLQVPYNFSRKKVAVCFVFIFNYYFFQKRLIRFVNDFKINDFCRS